MRALSVFPGGFTADAARHLLGALRRRLAGPGAAWPTSRCSRSPTPRRARATGCWRPCGSSAAARREDAGETELVIGRFLAWARDFGAAHHDSVLTGDDLAGLRADPGRAGQPGAGAAARARPQGRPRRSRRCPPCWAACGSPSRTSPALAALAADTARLLSHVRPEPALVEATRTAVVLGAVSGFLLRGPNPARFLVGLRRLPPAPPDTFARAAAGRAERAGRAARGGPRGAGRAVPTATSRCSRAWPTRSPATRWEGGRPGRRAGGGAAGARRVRAPGSAWLRAAAHSRIGELCLQLTRPTGDEALRAPQRGAVGGRGVRGAVQREPAARGRWCWPTCSAAPSTRRSASWS